MYLNTPEIDLPHAAAPEPQSNAPRVDLYSAIHKAMRQFMFDTTYRVGRMDINDQAEVVATLDQVDALLHECSGHLKRENEFVHPALESRAAGSSNRVMEEHFDHIDAIDSLHNDVLALRKAPPDRRAILSRALYLHLTLFVADNLAHMHVEETAHNSILWAKFSDAELEAIHGRIVASIDESEMAGVLRWMVPAITHQERVGMLGAMQASPMPREAFNAVLDLARPTLETKNWQKLSCALDVP
jgi:hypothetical protein